MPNTPISPTEAFFVAIGGESLKSMSGALEYFHSLAAQGTYDAQLIKTGKDLLAQKSISSDEVDEYAKAIGFCQSHAGRKTNAGSTGEPIEFRQVVPLPSGKDELKTGTDKDPMVSGADLRKLTSIGYLETGSQRLYFDKESEKVFIYEATALPHPAGTKEPKERFENAEYEIKNNIRSITAKAGSMPPGMEEQAQAAIEEYKKNPSEENLKKVEYQIGDLQDIIDAYRGGAPGVRSLLNKTQKDQGSK